MENIAPDYNKHREALDAARMRDMNRQQAVKGQDRNRHQAPIRQDRNRQSPHGAANTARNLASAATPTGALSLLKQIDFLGDIPYAAALGAAILKDLLDLVFIGSLPGLGTVITALCSIFIFMMMILVGAGGKKKAVNGLLKRSGLLMVGTIVEFVPGVDFFPAETVTVAAIYVLTLLERKNAQN